MAAPGPASRSAHRPHQMSITPKPRVKTLEKPWETFCTKLNFSDFNLTITAMFTQLILASAHHKTESHRYVIIMSGAKYEEKQGLQSIPTSPAKLLLSEFTK